MQPSVALSLTLPPDRKKHRTVNNVTNTFLKDMERMFDLKINDPLIKDPKSYAFECSINHVLYSGSLIQVKHSSHPYVSVWLRPCLCNKQNPNDSTEQTIEKLYNAFNDSGLSMTIKTVPVVQSA